MNNALRKLQWIILISALSWIGLCVALALCIAFIPDFEAYGAISLTVACIMVVFYTVLVSYYTYDLKKNKNKNELTVAEILGNDLEESYIFGQIGVLIVDENRRIIWANNYLDKVGMQLLDHPISEISKDLDTLFDRGDDSAVIKISYQKRFYLAKLVQEANLVIFKDITEQENERKVFTEEATIVGYLQIDNYSEVASSMDETTFTVKGSDLQKFLGEYASAYSMYLRPIKTDTFLILGNRKNFDRMYKDNFNIVDKVREMFPNIFTISIGFACGFPGIPAMAQEAREALDVALSRGGDQVVISPYGENLVYIGGKTESKHSENRAKVRILSQSFTTTVKNASNVLIIGHYKADFDAIGACIGVHAICKALKIPAKIVYDPNNVEDNTKHAFAKTFSSSQIAAMTANYNDAIALITSKTLLVVLDINYPDRLLYPNFIREDDDMKVAIIDHHRPGMGTFHNIVFNGIDSSASSTCELVTEYINSSKYKIELTPDEATFMLAGAMLDTDHFRNKVSAATFDAMVVLKRFGADSNKADDFLKEDFEQYSLKIKFMNNVRTPFTGILIATDPDENEIVDRSILAMVSQESMTIAGIDAVFTIGRVSPTEVGISARSNASVNVELIMRKMGGGGHFASAATAITSTSPSEVVAQLVEILDDYLPAARTRRKEDLTNTMTMTAIRRVQ